jgi:V/A-type H+-transporting ATPase subunit I
MAIEKMKRLKLAAIKSEREELLRKLMLLGCVEISEPQPLSEDSEYAGLLKRETAGAFERRSDFDELCWGVGLLDKYSPQKTGLFSPQPYVDRDTVLDETNLEKFLELAHRLDVTDDRIRTIDAKQSNIRATLEGLEPWRAMDVPVDYTETKTSFITIGMIPAATALGDVDRAIDEAGLPAQLFEISSDKEMHYVLIIAMKNVRQEITVLLQSFGFSLSSVSGIQGTVRENIDRLTAELNTLSEQKSLLIAEILAAAPVRDEMKLCADRMLTKQTQAENAERLLYTKSAYICEGWFPESDETRLTELLSEYNCAWEISDPTGEDVPSVPVKLRNNSLTRPLTMVTEMYSLPAYNGVDPNPFLMPSFALFFGIMFADIGYGLILLLVGLLIKLRVKPRGTMGYMGGIALICGVSCVVFGAVTGGFFGDIIPQVAAFFGGTAIMPALIDPLKEPMTVLIICIGIGIVHMLVGVTINGYMLVRDGQWFDALCDAGSVYLMFAGIALGALGITWYVAIAAVVFVIYAQGRQSKSVFGILGLGLYGLYSFASGWFGDILSYCRLMALMLAGTVIAQVFNTLGAMTGNIIAFAVIFLLGHALNFGLNIIGTYVHTSRLEYLEFFGKFYREGGRAFEPLEVKSNYYSIYNN